MTDALAVLPTPSLVLDEGRMLRNVDRLRRHLAGLGVAPRPHLKTVKSVEAARRVLADGTGPATVSTLREAEVFAAAGVRDILYGVGIAPQKLPRVLALRAAGCDLSLVLDSPAQAEAVAQASRRAGDAVPVLIEIDSDGHRSGLRPEDPAVVAIGRLLEEGGAALRGVVTHAGESYGATGAEALAAFAERERRAAVAAAEALRAAGLPCPVVSVGSTPTAHRARDLSGVTEVRAGVYVLFDLVMAGIGVCTLDDIALSVLTTVIGHQRERGWIVVDAGWMALSRDRGTAAQAVDQGYGVVCDAGGRVLDDLIVEAANQEHGIVAVRPGSRAALPDLAVGTRLRILPNHACATGAQFDAYAVLPADGTGTLAHWDRFRGW
ncbi:D-threo-3-hydroxyaspartate dehydratase [Methylobacterium crusticola]|uniref:D-threo-3-hydroxyaspartate dehydratase n=1 Tax=Methylobacterium crusticola TaxID=1697972 RepID=A0ABQ4R4F0_9HYPH|nr:alanine racemase [Methylobacterium crusticola]GJD52568.1 D-threo-3-hydroxyaspartate dehydratase [Methylobacterium crusticola]